jgi:hypothetical protein
MESSLYSINARDLNPLYAVLAKYQEVSRKSWEQIIDHEQSEWRWGLWHELKAISPKPEGIYNAAVKRDFSIRRQGDSITKTDGNFSRAARSAAESQIGTDKSDLFRVEVTPNGVFIKPVRFSARKSEKLLTGGRSGRKFADNAKRAKDTSEEAIAKARQADPSIKRLNLQALSVALELSLRSRAAKGGMMALQFLGSNFKRRKSSTVKTGPIVIRSSKGIPLGVVEIHRAGDATEAVISALVPNTGKQISRHGIIGAVQAARIADRRKYIDDRMTEAKQKALQN